MLINLSNHPKNKWSEKQLIAALRKYKSVVDLPFPLISPNANTLQVKKKAEKYLKQILKLLKSSEDKKNAVHLMGEFTFVFHLATMLKNKSISTIVSTTNRIVEEREGKKIVTFNFVRFREY
ncbi:Putative CRISPR-associated protein [Ignavibacterium album JCM 16511]|uniref:Putative CRISPR-associated protein n=1 Tax=Ignavibacterium album (strain DSM 19864 / JCM 16511 / NBRC 101810 / Mat9-16) TaxID=945713 RepID=I0AIV4_IGNAJ|nr:hypothetical protein [Ignavibacterium album]AFH48911.1 Putative CRISPR-associated protein [Ignavibacterium album JCM 16511]